MGIARTPQQRPRAPKGAMSTADGLFATQPLHSRYIAAGKNQHLDTVTLLKRERMVYPYLFIVEICKSTGFYKWLCSGYVAAM